MPRKILFIFQILIAGAFLGLFIGSFFAADTVKESASEQLILKTVTHTNKIIAVAEEALEDPLIKGALADHQREVITAEITSYREDPHLYVAALIKEPTTPPLFDLNQETNSLKRKLLEKLTSWKQSSRAYFDKTFKRLLIDIRIFCFSNIIGMLIAAWIIRSDLPLRSRPGTISVLITIAIAGSILSYWNQNWYFSVLLNNYMGYWYPISMAMLYMQLANDYRKFTGRDLHDSKPERVLPAQKPAPAKSESAS